MHFEACDNAEEAITWALRLWHEGIAVLIATPETHGRWGIYLMRRALPAR